MKAAHINSLPILIVSIALVIGLSAAATVCVADGRGYNSSYTGAHLNKVAFPIGGIGAGMFCLEGTGAISHVSVKNRMDFFNEPCTFAAVCIKGQTNVARVIEGPIPDWKYFGGPMTGRGSTGASYGLPRFRKASFLARFPFGTVTLTDNTLPLDVEIIGWSPFIPGDSDDSSLPVGALEYRFKNPTDELIEGVFSFHSRNFMATDPRRGNSISPMTNGFVLRQQGTKEAPHEQGQFAVFVDDEEVVVDHGWFRGSHYDAFTLVWKNIQEGVLLDNPAMKGPSPGASLFVPFSESSDRPGSQERAGMRGRGLLPLALLRALVRLSFQEHSGSDGLLAQELRQAATAKHAFPRYVLRYDSTGRSCRGGGCQPDHSQITYGAQAGRWPPLVL